jgi:signal transduction histidine kinase
VGTTLAHGSYVELVGHEHFIRGFHPFTCQGIPIHDSEGKVVAGISTSLRSPGASAKLRDVFFCAAHAIEAEILMNRIRDDLIEASKGSSDQAALERLREDLALAGSRYRVSVAQLPAGNDLASAETILDETRSALERFKVAARRWRALAGSEIGAPELFSFTDLVDDVLELLAPELRRRRISLHWLNKDEVVTFGYMRPLARSLMRDMLDEISRTEEEIYVSVDRIAADRVRFQFGGLLRESRRLDRPETVELRRIGSN